MYSDYRFERIVHQYETLDRQCRSMYDEICYLREYINNVDKYLNECNLDSLVEFFIKNPDTFNKIVVKIRKEKIKNIEK